jgi:1-deoxy-D-xylulose-5-phosphate synthase
MKSPENPYPLLQRIDSPVQLRHLPEASLLQLADELRNYLITTVSETGGHFASNLGVIELTIALHYVFNTPEDRLVWDVGHQSYPHKILTGRRDALNTIRQKDGLSGFPKRSESEYDTFGVGHSSTSISAALGMAIAAKLSNQQRKTIAIIGDGAMTAGMAFEALNHAGDIKANILVILNDNDMSISPNVGALKQYFGKILSSRFYAHLREGGKKILSHTPSFHDVARLTEEHVKGMFVPGTLFEEFGFNYIGPIDGHNLSSLVSTLKNIKALEGPQFLHIVTRKGKGFEPAEQDPCVYHGVSAFDKITGKFETKPSKPTYTQIFGDWLCDMAAVEEKLIAITPAMREGSGLVAFSEKYPERYFDVGIAEQHAVTLAAGMACDGLKPVVAIYSTFLQRGYDQLIHDVALQNLPILFAVDRAGLVGADGATHAGMFDLSFLRCIPNLLIMSPADENECRQMLTTGFLHNAPSVVRYPRGSGTGKNVEKSLTSIQIGKADIRRQGKQVALLAFGSLVPVAQKVGETLNATVVNMRFVKPLDEALILQMAERHDLLVTLEENVIAGGVGSAIAEYLATQNINLPILHLGLPDIFVEQGTQAELLEEVGLDEKGILQRIKQRLAFLFHQSVDVLNII